MFSECLTATVTPSALSREEKGGTTTPRKNHIWISRTSCATWMISDHLNDQAAFVFFPLFYADHVARPRGHNVTKAGSPYPSESLFNEQLASAAMQNHKKLSDEIPDSSHNSHKSSGLCVKCKSPSFSVALVLLNCSAVAPTLVANQWRMFLP